MAFLSCRDYASPVLPDIVSTLLDTVGCQSLRGAKVLVKPNLLAPQPPDFLPCTHPRVVRAVCEYLLGLGARVSVGDSPSLSTGIKVSIKIGLHKALADLPVALINLDQPRLIQLSFPGGMVGISRQALESDFILNLPKLKTHRMVRLTGAVKNFFGCVTGLRKGLCHFLYGDRGYRFEKMIVELMAHLPPSISLLDAIVAMHKDGPVKGAPFPFGLLAASPSAVALDTALYGLLGLLPVDIPIWREAIEQRLAGVNPEEIYYPLEPPTSFDVTGFQIPAQLQALNFHPLRLAKNALKKIITKP